MSGASRDAAENMENSSVAFENDPTANLPSKKLKLAGGNNDETPATTTDPRAPSVPSPAAAAAAAVAAATAEEPRGESKVDASVNEDPSESASAAASSEKALESPEEKKGAKDKHDPSDDGLDGSTSSPPFLDVAETEATEVEDSAVLHQQLKDGDRIQVLWTIESNTGSSNSSSSSSSSSSHAAGPEGVPGANVVVSTQRWWGAALLPWDGSAEQDVAIRTLRYDAYPPDFPHETDELVVFADTKNRLVTYPGLDPMIFRREEGGVGDAASGTRSATAAHNHDDDGSVVVTGREGMEQLVDGMLMGALHKNGASWGALSAARKAEIAEAIAIKKARLLELMEEHLESHDVISAADMQGILARTMALS
jgi:hypothetical protein